jgi:hypothetical protein
VSGKKIGGKMKAHRTMPLHSYIALIVIWWNKSDYYYDRYDLIEFNFNILIKTLSFQVQLI